MLFDTHILSQTDSEKLRKTQQIIGALLGGDADYDDLKAYLKRQHPEKFDADEADLGE